MRPHAFGLLTALLWSGTAHAQPSARSAPGTPQQVPRSAPFIQAAASAGAAQPSSLTPLRSFDPATTGVQNVDGRWVILAGGAVLKEFGPREADARAALQVIRGLKLNQHGTVGTPPVMEYWLSDGHAPYAAETGLRVVPLDLNTLQVDQLDGQWRLRDSHRLLFNFGGQRDEAYHALDVIRHYGFRRLGHVGQFVPSMLYFLGSAADQARAPSLPPPQLAARQPVQRGAAKPPPALVQAGFTTPAQAEPPPPPRTEHRRFDFRRVEVRRDRNEWKLMHGRDVLANFGQNQMDAQLAWNTVQYYHFSEQCLIGRPTPAFSYFLIGGQAPRGLKFGILTQPLRPEAVLVRPAGQGWVVSEGEQTLVAFDRVEDARELADAIQRYRFDHLCRVGSGMTFFVRCR